MKFSVTAQIASQEDIEIGEAGEADFACIDEDLRTAVDVLFQTRTNEVGGVEDISPASTDYSGWITVNNAMEFRTGCYESRSLHFPPEMTRSSRRRLCRLLQGN